MGKYEDKIMLHFWKLFHSTTKDIGNVDNFKERFDSIIKVKVREAWEIVQDEFWAELYSIIQETRDPDKLHERLDPMIKIDATKVKENFWKLFLVSKVLKEDNFRENFEPIFKINLLEAWELVDKHFWAKIYSLTKKTQDIKELYLKLDPMVKIDIKQASEAIKEDDPDKYDLLVLLK